MLGNVTSLTGGQGLRDWLFQRATAVVMGIYAVFLIIYLINHPHLTYHQWHDLFSSVVMRVASEIILISILMHAWVGFWTVTTDYLHQTCVRLFVQSVVALGLLALFIWGLEIFWGM